MFKNIIMPILALGVAAIAASTAYSRSSHILERWSHGTIDGLNACTENLASGLFSDEELRLLCAAKHEQSITLQISSITGRGNAVIDSQNRSSFSGTIQNRSANYLITAIEVTLTI